MEDTVWLMDCWPLVLPEGLSVHLNFSATMEVMWEEDAGTAPSRQTSHSCKEPKETKQSKGMEK